MQPVHADRRLHPCGREGWREGASEGEDKLHPRMGSVCTDAFICLQGWAVSVWTGSINADGYSHPHGCSQFTRAVTFKGR
jgi:hypothetical protein